MRNLRRDIECFTTAKRDGAIHLVIDLETTIVRDSDGKPTPMPEWGARPVMYGITHANHPSSAAFITKEFGCFMTELESYLRANPNVVLIGQNIKFDLRHMMRLDFLRTRSLLRECMAVIDTSVNEYLLSGQSHRSPSLDFLCSKYGHPTPKGGAVSEAFKNGIGADQIDEEVLKDYLIDDLRATGAVFNAQMAAAPGGLLPHFWVQGKAVAAYAMMEHEGLHYDKTRTDELADAVQRSLDANTDFLTRMIARQLGIPMLHASPTPRAISTILFGGPGVKYKEPKVVGRYKNGKPKTKLVEQVATPLTGPLMDPATLFNENEYNPTVGWPVNDAVLDRVLEHNAPGPNHQRIRVFVESVRKVREMGKLQSTYLSAIRNGIDGGADYIQHHSLNATVTGTGRTSSSSPNAQNMPTEVRKLVVPARPGWEILQVDWSQLEVWGAAVLSGDPTLLDDVRTSDIHWETGRKTFGWRTKDDMDKEGRRTAKGVNFGTIYGGGAKTLAKQTGADLAVVKKHIKNFFARYPVFKAWQDKLFSSVCAIGDSPPMEERQGYLLGTKRTTSVTGRRLYHETVPFSVSWKKQVELQPSRSAVVNYPVQSFATADWHPLFLVALAWYSALQGDTGVVFANVVHDSIVLQVQLSKHAWVKALIEKYAQAMPRLCEIVYGYRVPFAPTVDFEADLTWF